MSKITFQIVRDAPTAYTAEQFIAYTAFDEARRGNHVDFVILDDETFDEVRRRLKVRSLTYKPGFDCFTVASPAGNLLVGRRT